MCIKKTGEWIWMLLIVETVVAQSRSHYNPAILQDTRLEPRVDGTFGFQYKTEDGIVHAAKGDPSGFIQGTYSYKDPTGLKVNFNYFAGSRGTTQPQREVEYSTPQQQVYREEVPYETEYRPRTRPSGSYTQHQSYVNSYPRY